MDCLRRLGSFATLRPGVAAGGGSGRAAEGSTSPEPGVRSRCCGAEGGLSGVFGGLCPCHHSGCEAALQRFELILDSLDAS